jgi:phosphoglycerate dehydrogenase-like enzyme
MPTRKGFIYSTRHRRAAPARGTIALWWKSVSVQIAVKISEGFAALEARASGIRGLRLLRCDDEATLLDALPMSDALVIGGSHYRPTVADALKGRDQRVRWIQFASAGIDAAARFGVAPGIVVTNAAAAFAPTVAEHAMALALAAVRRIVEIDRERDTARPREQYIPQLTSVEGRTLVSVGYGHVGRELVARAAAFGMKTLVATRRPETVDDPRAEAHPLADLHRLLARADVVIIAIALTRETRHLIDATALAAMPSTAWIVNVARGAVVDEAALIAALQDQRIAGAALDVTTIEPLPSDSPLRRLPNVVVTPHIGGFGSEAAMRRLADIVVDNIALFAAGEPLRNIVDRARLDAS